MPQSIVVVNKIPFIHRTFSFIHKRRNNVVNHYYTLQVRLYKKSRGKSCTGWVDQSSSALRAISLH